MKGTVYRGTVDYESERGTYIRPDTKQENLPVRTSSIIFEEEEELKTVNQEISPELPQEKKGKPV